MSDLGLEIRLPSTAFLRIFDQNNARFDLQNDELFFLLKKGQIKMIANDLKLIPKLEFDKVVILNMAAYDLELEYLTQYLVNLAEEAGIILRDKAEPIKITSNIEKACATSADEFLTALTAFGIKLEKKKADAIIANDVSSSNIGFNADNHQVTILTKEGKQIPLPECSKDALAFEIWKTLVGENVIR